MYTLDNIIPHNTYMYACMNIPKLLCDFDFKKI